MFTEQQFEDKGNWFEWNNGELFILIRTYDDIIVIIRYKRGNIDKGGRVHFNSDVPYKTVLSAINILIKPYIKN